MKQLKVIELQPCGRQKSFYGKAHVVIDALRRKWLISYDSVVAMLDAEGKLHRLPYKYGYSATTGRHLKAFAGVGKREYLALPEEDLAKGFLVTGCGVFSA